MQLTKFGMMGSVEMPKKGCMAVISSLKYKTFGGYHSTD
jgi:hypothetical protein